MIDKLFKRIDLFLTGEWKFYTNTKPEIKALIFIRIFLAILSLGVFSISFIVFAVVGGDSSENESIIFLAFLASLIGQSTILLLPWRHFTKSIGLTAIIVLLTTGLAHFLLVIMAFITWIESNNIQEIERLITLLFSENFWFIIYLIGMILPITLFFIYRKLYNSITKNPDNFSSGLIL